MTEARLDFSHVRPTEAYVQSVEEAEREKPRWARGSARRPKAPADGSDDVAGIHEIVRVRTSLHALICAITRATPPISTVDIVTTNFL